MFIDSPHYGNREVARQIGVSEAAIRKWKKLPFWEEIKQQLINERSELFKTMVEKDRDKYIKDLETQYDDLKIYQQVFKSNLAHSIKLSNQGYIRASQEADPLVGCLKATKAGVHYHSRVAMENLGKILQINEQMYQIELIKTNFEDDDDDIDSED